MKHANLALLAAAATGVQVGAAIAASRMVVAEVPPLTLAMLRYVIGSLCLLPFIFRPFGSIAPDSGSCVATKTVAFSDLAAMAPVAAVGLGQFALLIALLNFGLQHIGAAGRADLQPVSTLGALPVVARAAPQCGIWQRLRHNKTNVLIGWLA